MVNAILKKTKNILSGSAFKTIYFLSFLPLGFWYLVSDFSFLIIYYLLKYRVKVTRTNLKNSFPEKSEEALKEIERKFYRHLTNIMAETIKSFSISDKELKKRIKIENGELLENLFKKNISLIAVTGHFNNWEWAAMSLPFHSRYKAQGLYLPIKNESLNTLMQSSRARFGIDLIETTDLQEEMKRRSKLLTITGFIADQSPSNPLKAYWMNFLNQQTAVAFGTEKYARQYNLGVVFGKISRIKRGYYCLRYELVCEDPKDLPEGEITRKHTQMLEQLIRNHPERWLWSHRRWKLKQPENIETS